MKQLYLTHAEVRRLYGSEYYASPSRFIGEIPEGLLQPVRAAAAAPRWPVAEPVADYAGARADDAGMRLGSRVRHAKFGEGVVLNYEGQGAQARVQVHFEQAGSKWLVLAYANLQSLH
jgi:DNA helicase-2/ATP-dependent DNA helicase PcrA